MSGHFVSRLRPVVTLWRGETISREFEFLGSEGGQAGSCWIHAAALMHHSASVCPASTFRLAKRVSMDPPPEAVGVVRLHRVASPLASARSSDWL